MEQFFKPEPNRKTVVRYWCVSCMQLKRSSEYSECEFNPNGKNTFCKKCEVNTNK